MPFLLGAHLLNGTYQNNIWVKPNSTTLTSSN